MKIRQNQGREASRTELLIKISLCSSEAKDLHLLLMKNTYVLSVSQFSRHKLDPSQDSCHAADLKAIRSAASLQRRPNLLNLRTLGTLINVVRKLIRVILAHLIYDSSAVVRMLNVAPATRQLQTC